MNSQHNTPLIFIFIDVIVLNESFQVQAQDLVGLQLFRRGSLGIAREIRWKTSNIY